jgi:hypothetical protein
MQGDGRLSLNREDDSYTIGPRASFAAVGSPRASRLGPIAGGGRDLNLAQGAVRRTEYWVWVVRDEPSRRDG